MNTPTARSQAFIQQRRSQRILLSIPIIVSGKRANGSPFSERTNTLVVNAHGALIRLNERVLVNQVLRMKNIATNEEVGCSVVDINRRNSDVTEVGVGFTTPAPSFWRVAFPPEDWTPRSPEAKRTPSASPSSHSLPALVKK